MEPPQLPSNAIAGDHPLLNKFQKTLGEHLRRVIEQTQKETDEIDGQIHLLNEEREEIGSNLYDLQHEIDRQKDEIDSLNNNISDLFEKRIKCEEETRTSKQHLKDTQKDNQNMKRMHKEQLIALDRLRIIEQRIEKWQQDMAHEFKVSKLVLSKDRQERDRICKEKRQLDFILLNLELEVKRRETESNDILAQIKDNEQHLDQSKRKLVAANTDLDAMQSENRRLISSWNDVIQAIANRDKLLAGTHENLTKENDQIKTIEKEIEATKKHFLKETEKNEKLEQFKKRLTEDYNHLNKQFEKACQENAALADRMEQMTALLEETESSYHKADVENHLLTRNLKSIRRNHERQTENKLKQEKRILELLQSQVTTDHASKIEGRNIQDVQNKRRDLERIMNNTEVQLSESIFELEKLKGDMFRSRNHAEELRAEKLVLDGKATEYDKDLENIKSAIQIKFKLNDRLNKQLAQLVEAAGGKEDDPLHLKIRDLEMTIGELETQMKDDQNNWLRLQSHIVEMSQKMSMQLNDSHIARQQLSVIGQKTVHINNELSDIAKQDQHVQRDIINLNTKLDILGGKLFEKRQNNAIEHDQYQFEHLKMIDKLRNEEMDIVRLKNDITNVSYEIEDLKKIVMDKHEEALSWETKWKLVEETKRENDAEYAKTGEISAMKSEIHRMDVRYGELKRAQEKLVADMELCVHHREHVFDQANVRSKLSHKQSKQINTMQYRIKEFQSKLKQVFGETNAIEKEIAHVLNNQELVTNEISRINQAIDIERNQYALLQNEIEEAILLRQGNLDGIVRLQNRTKRYQSIVRAIQVPKTRNEDAVDMSLQKNVEINEHLLYVLENLSQEFPEQKFPFQRIRQTLID